MLGRREVSNRAVARKLKIKQKVSADMNLRLVNLHVSAVPGLT